MLCHFGENAEKRDEPKKRLQVETMERSDGASSKSGARLEGGQATKAKKPDNFENQSNTSERMVQFKMMEPPQDPWSNL